LQGLIVVVAIIFYDLRVRAAADADFTLFADNVKLLLQRYRVYHAAEERQRKQEQEQKSNTPDTWHAAQCCEKPVI